MQVTYAPPIYQSAIAEIPSNQYPTQSHVQTLFQSQRQRTDIVGSEQSVAPYEVINSQSQIYLQPQQIQRPPAPYAIQQQAVPMYPINRQSQLPVQQLQPQQQTSYLQVQQPQQQFYTTNQQSTIPIRPLPQSHLSQKVFLHFII